MNFKVISSETLFNGRVFDLKVDKIKYDSGNESVREIAVHNGGAVVVAVTDENKIIFVKQYRYPFDKFMIELPAGKLEASEDPSVCALRELKEETGYSTDNLDKLGTIATTPGFCTELLHIYLAQNLIPGETEREEGEYGMELLELSLEEAEQAIIDGSIYDGKTLAGLFYYKLRLLKK